jgi:RNA polymerase sigma factor (sigma-70 family)
MNVREGPAPAPFEADGEARAVESELEHELAKLEPRGAAGGVQESVARRAPALEASARQLAQWIGAIARGDERALASLYDATLARVYSAVLRVVRRPALADEVVEDTYFQVWRQAVRFDPARGHPLVWLLGMARSRAVDALRREARFQHESLETQSPPESQAEAPAGDELLDTARSHADLHRALLLLNAQPRQLVALAYLRGMSHEEIAQQTRLPLGTVKSQIRRSLATLRGLLGDAAPPALVS